MTRIFVIVAFALSTTCLADAPPSEPKPYRICDYTVTYCASLVPGEDARIYELTGDLDDPRTELIYTIPGWHRSAHISPTGEYFVTGYPGLNLLPLDVERSEIVVTIWKRGKIHKTVSIGEVLKSMDSLNRTVSHYNWGGVDRVGHTVALVRTVEGIVWISLATGEVEFGDGK